MKRRKNPTKNETGYSLNEMYEMKTNNSNAYSTETFESLEFGEDMDFNDEQEQNDKVVLIYKKNSNESDFIE